MDLMDELIQDIESKSRDLSSVFSLKSGETKRIRFLTEGNAGLAFDSHGRFVKGNARAGWTVPCPTSIEKYAKGRKVETYNKHNCPYCQFKNDKATSTLTEKKYAWLIWNYTDGCLQAFVYKISEKSPLTKLARRYKKTNPNTIMDRDFDVVKGTGDFPATDIDSDDPAPFTITDEMKRKGCFVPKNNIEAQKKILELMAKAWCPTLLSSDEEFILPEEHQPQDSKSATSAVKDIESIFGGDDEMLPEINVQIDDDSALEELEDL